LNAAGKMLVMLCGVTLAGTLWAADDDPDVELLEFLGSWEGEDDEWQEFFDSVALPPTEDAADSDMNDRSTQRDSD